MPKIHNLDEQVEEHFEFIVKGHRYRFRHMNTEELEHLKEIEDDDEKTKKYFYSFISAIDKKSPNWESISKKMIVPQLRKFTEMIKVEFGS